MEDCGFLLARVSIGSSEPKKAQPGAEAWREAEAAVGAQVGEDGASND